MPFLDHELVEFAMALPERMKVRDGVGKYLLKKAVEARSCRETSSTGASRASARRWRSGSAGELGRPGAAHDPRARRCAERGLLDYDQIDRLWAAHRGGAGLELPALEPLQRERLVRPLGRRARHDVA